MNFPWGFWKFQSIKVSVFVCFVSLTSKSLFHELKGHPAGLALAYQMPIASSPHLQTLGQEGHPELRILPKGKCGPTEHCGGMGFGMIWNDWRASVFSSILEDLYILWSRNLTLCGIMKVKARKVATSPLNWFIDENFVQICLGWAGLGGNCHA